MIRRVAAQRFRNLEPLELELEGGSTLLLGPTGAGKTSVLEAIYVAATTRSFRTSKLEDCVRVGIPAEDAGIPAEEVPGFWARLDVEGARRSTLEVSWSPSMGLERRLDGERSSIAEHLDRQPVLAYSWEDGETWVAEPDLRRRFVDRGLVAERATSLDALSRYRKVLAHKRSLLAEGRPRAADLEPWNELFAEAAGAVRVLRATYVERLAEAMAEVIELSGLELPGVGFAYRPSPAVDIGDGQALREALARSTTREIEARRPLIGPHRDGIDLALRGQPVGKVASSGERKGLALLAVAAQARLLRDLERAVALLIDDADVELDRPTLRGVWKALRETLREDGQMLLSSNRPEVWERLEPEHDVRLGGGRVEAS